MEQKQVHCIWFLMWTLTMLIGSIFLPKEAKSGWVSLGNAMVIFSWLMSLYHLVNFVITKKVIEKK